MAALRSLVGERGLSLIHGYAYFFFSLFRFWRRAIKQGAVPPPAPLKGSGLFCPAVANASGLPRCGARSDVQISFPPG